MRKLYTIIGTIFMSSLSSFAQPVLNASDLTTGFSYESYSVPDMTGLTAGNAGPNQVWDFSLLTVLAQSETLGTVPVSSAPFYENFPSANYCFKFSSSIDPSYYLLMEKNSSALMFVGDSDSSDYSGYSNPNTLLQFPFTYDSTFEDTYQYVGDPDTYTVISHYDAYGTLITPFGTYYDVIRQKRTDAGYTTYLWYNTNPFAIIMEGDFTVGDEYLNFYKVTSELLGVNKNNISDSIAVYPNPSSSIINIQLPMGTTVDNVIITDLMGKTVQKNNYSQQINIENLTSGMYIIQAFSNENVFQTKFVKK